MTHHTDAQEVLQERSDEQRRIATNLIDKYGEPDELTPSLLIWNGNGPWHATVVSRHKAHHLFPMPHTDFVEQYISYHVPPEKVDELVAFDGSVVVRRTEGLLSARCHDEAANFLALNLAHDIVTGEKDVQQARQAYVQKMKDYRAGKPTPYMEALQFEPQSDAADPDEKLISKEELEAVAA